MSDFETTLAIPAVLRSDIIKAWAWRVKRILGTSEHELVQDARGFEAVHHRHGQIEDDQIWFQLNGFLHRFAAVHGFGVNFQEGVIFKQAPERFAEVRIVVGDENPFAGCGQG
jgi:hypothetical protein